ncbi:MAG: hypothetical protein K8R58_13330 [Bacteroidales bacterium]|nr:hypothetical protein [Bacteroidales bacterium]
MLDNQNLILSVSLIFLCVLLFVFHQQIRLFLLRVFYGKYNYYYGKLYDQIYFKRFDRICVDNEYIQQYNQILSMRNNYRNYITDNQISFSSIPYLTKFKNVLKQKGRPRRYNIAKIGTSVLKRLEYIDSVRDADLKVSYYFVDGVLFMGEYMFSDVKEIEGLNIPKFMIKKYLNSDFANENIFYIQHKPNSLIYFENNGLNLSIKYLYTNGSPIKKAISQHFENIKNNELVMDKNLKIKMNNLF